MKRLALSLIAISLTTSCAVHQDTQPSPSGPAELALSLKLEAVPDHLVQDGSQSSKVSIIAFDAGGHPIVAQVKLSLQPAGFGTLSFNNITTGSSVSNPATVIYTPPAATSGNGANVTITATMVGPDSTGNSTQQVSLVVQPAASISVGAPTAAFTISPSSTIIQGHSVTLDGSSSCGSQLVAGACPGTSKIVSYNWSFGDNATGTGPVVTHAYVAANTFNVTLTVLNDKGLSTSASQSVTVSPPGTVSPPSPSFTFSPAAPGVGDAVFFNASLSSAAAGHSIVSYAWVFGDGSTATGVTASHTYSVSATYNVQLTVTDDLGQSTTSAGTAVAIGNPPAPTANFTSSPVSPTVVDSIVFDASSSSTAQGQTITNLAWNFGDASPIISCPGDPTCVGTRVITHKYGSAATYVVNLVVTDSAGRIGSHNATVTVATGNPQPVITASPSSGTHPLIVNFSSGSSVFFNGATAVSYSWDFGDGTTGTNSANQTHTYLAAGSYVVRLTITDNFGRTGTSTATVTVS